MGPRGTVHQTTENEEGGLRREPRATDKDLAAMCIDTATEGKRKTKRGLLTSLEITAFED